mmetsp:Transcript_54406/g.107996  ORF Transcript_54406/g.107996 Transcript_54406/m.107996 type:complete len:604 (+) Transcript_54406:214-2025(+)
MLRSLVFFSLGILGIAIIVHSDTLIDYGVLDAFAKWAQLCQKETWKILIPSALYCSLCRTARLDGQIVGDCSCDFETVDAATHDYFHPLLEKLQQTTFFRYFKVGLDEECPFWDDSSEMCALKDCAVEACKPEAVPHPWRLSDENETNGKKESAAAASLAFSSSSDSSSLDGGLTSLGSSSGCSPEWARPRGDGNGDGSVGAGGSSSSSSSSISGDVLDREGFLGRVSRAKSGDPGSEGLRGWSEGDDDSELWIAQNDNDHAMVYVDLLANPERFTGYVGDSPHRIWSAIHDENCFEEAGQCLEKRVFYRLLSGLQSSITTHIAKGYYYGAKGSYGGEGEGGYWGPNTALFVEGVGKHPDRLHNLYFTYLFLLRALSKAAAELESFDYSTGNSTGGHDDDDDTARALVRALTSPDHPLIGASKDAQVCQRGFDESRLFQPSPLARQPAAPSSSFDANTAFENLEAISMDGSFERFDDFMKASTAASAAATAAAAAAASTGVVGGGSAAGSSSSSGGGKDVALPFPSSSSSLAAAASAAKAAESASAPDADSALRLAAAEEAVLLRGEFQARFRNISRIMDCVGCERCRLWGKLQVQLLVNLLS